ncbi:DUF5689 domain-containing protein [Zhouia sp. PK063]|uniref:DUF5689 domain-containing protein n=1 Tax=Zhouia sp. PK063 TaxID=3373602 RepID=UPI0037ADB8A5
MKKSYTIKFILTIIILGFFTGCVTDDNYSIPKIECSSPDISANISIAEIKTMFNGNIVKIQDDLIIEGYVVSSDESGNIYQNLMIQDKLEHPTNGIQLYVGLQDYYNSYPVGTKVLVKLKDLYLGQYGGVIQIGGTESENAVGKIEIPQAKEHLFKTCDPPAAIVPTITTVDGIDANMINTLVQFQNVQISTADVGKTYAVAQQNTNITITDCNGNTITLRNSGYADFQSEILPSGNGSITAILGQYNGTYQLTIRDTTDVDFSADRCGDDVIEGGAGGIGGDTASFESCLSEDFSSFDVDSEEFGAYENYAVVGDRYWQVKTFSNQKYISLSAYNATNALNTTYFIVPVDFDKADVFSFQSKDGYNNGDPLKVYYTTDYSIGNDVTAATLTEITNEFTISTGNTNGYATSFVNSGEFDLSSISGQGYIIFAYTGSANGITTTMQLTNISLKDNDDSTCSGSTTGGAIGGENAVALKKLNEDFESYNVSKTSFPGYENYAFEGNLYWSVEEFQDNKYLKMSAYNSSDTSNKAYFIIPVNFDDAKTFSFKTVDGFNNGDPLKVYYATNYTIGADFTQASLVDITNKFTISTGNTGNYGSTFTASGEFDLSSISGNGVLVFEYDSTGGVTTTMEIDDISIVGEDTSGGDNSSNTLAFVGGDFENEMNLGARSLMSYATYEDGTGIEGSKSLHIQTSGTSSNDYVFSTLSPTTMPSSYSKITFKLKGTAGSKSISINLYDNSGGYYRFNLGEITANTTITSSGSNSYSGSINTNGDWVTITLDLSEITDLNTDTSKDLFALKIGKASDFNVYLDDFYIQ